MARLDILCFWLSLVCSCGFRYSYESSIAYERPVHTVVVQLALCAFFLLGASKLLPTLFQVSNQDVRYTEVPLEEIGGLAKLENKAESSGPNAGRVRVSILLFSTSILSARLELYRRLVRATECTVIGAEAFLPLLIAVYGCIRLEKRSNVANMQRPGHTVYEIVLTKLQTYLVQPRSRYILSALMLSYSSYSLISIRRSLNSTYICSIANGQNNVIPVLQFSCLVLDFLLAVIIQEMAPKKDGSGLSARRIAIMGNATMLGAALVWSSIAFILYIFKPELRVWLLLLNLPWKLKFAWSLFWQTLLFSLFFIATSHSIIVYGILEVIMSLTALNALVQGLSFVLFNRNPFPPYDIAPTMSACLFILGGWWSFRWIRQHLESKNERSVLNRSITIITFGLLLLSPLFKHVFSHFHPIDLLIYEANSRHEMYFNSLQHQKSLNEAVTRYQARYRRNPPPGFDVWFEYAMNSSALNIDEYDQIYDDLLPFQVVSPSDLRRQTWEMVSNPWNEISGITIRDGTAAVQENVLPTHRWMLEGVAILINSFARYLPDMDLAFNLNDESRVAMPFGTVKSLRDQAKSHELSGQHHWSANRSEGWLAIPEHPFRETVFNDLSFRNTFAKYGSIGCPPTSRAIKHPHISSQSHICLECVAPHSLGQFVSNWSLAADICHQPDMAYLHGFYLSPAAFKTSYQPMPVFSQSKPHGFNDILYPSAWNYMDKVKYDPNDKLDASGIGSDQQGFPDPSFLLKQNTLFWRGATSEGVSSGDHTWRGMTRQRLVHLTNNLTSSSHDDVTILLPDPDRQGKYKYQTVSGLSMKDLGLHVDIAIVDHIARCGGIGLHDCTDQDHEFALVQPSDFQAHWQYRYLFDLDGAGFSGRFIPFLQSRSLPFKTALFREWYDSRITAWKHFVPQDIRLHGVWSTLAYFAGVNGTMRGKQVLWNPHLKEAERIAEDGRAWADTVLRKQDMEIYFFRLLLEWGRLTDDNRDNLGFTVA